LDEKNLEMDTLRREVGKVVREPLGKIFDICIKHPDQCNPLYEVDWDPHHPDPELVLGDSIVRYINLVVNSQNVPTLSPNQILPDGTVITSSGSTWNIKVNPAANAIQAVLSKTQNAQIAVQQLEQVIKVNEKTIAMQKMILRMAKEQIED